MNILDRLEEIRLYKRLNKGQFEGVIGKSSGYIGTLRKTESVPGVDVILRISKNYPEINLDWLLSGEGEMLKNESQITAVSEDPNSTMTLEQVRNEIRGDLKVIVDALKENFEVISDGIFQGLKDQQKILKFIEDLDAEEVRKASRVLGQFLKEKNGEE